MVITLIRIFIFHQRRCVYIIDSQRVWWWFIVKSTDITKPKMNTRKKKYNKVVKKSSHYAENKPRVYEATALDTDIVLSFSAAKIINNIVLLYNTRIILRESKFSLVWNLKLNLCNFWTTQSMVSSITIGIKILYIWSL